MEKICGSSDFRRSKRLTRFLRYIVCEKLEGSDARLKAYSIALAVFDRPASFDGQIDPVVRIEAGRLRRALERYYHSAGKDDPIVISVPRGGYVPAFQKRTEEGYVGCDEHETCPEEKGYEPSHHQLAMRARPRSNGMRWSVAVAAAVVALLATLVPFWVWDDGQYGPNSSSLKPLVAVTPFVAQRGDASAEQIAKGFSEQLIDQLASFSDLRILGREAISQAPDEPRGSAWTRFNVRYVIEGNVVMSSKGGVLTARLVDARSGQILWIEHQTIDNGAELPPKTQANLAQKISDTMSRTSLAFSGGR
ncbi:hypothetical protein [Alsobacter metallidurans]|uniref:hypothetical protein n=1 Tax=Alsobacter metallidurans TaxID=340221 RepID=UPI00166A7562|nr:hypothetical protein [Alsobacter metallidurans]